MTSLAPWSVAKRLSVDMLRETTAEFVFEICDGCMQRHPLKFPSVDCLAHTVARHAVLQEHSGIHPARVA